MKILLTGFQPFGGHDTNPSWQCLEALGQVPGAEVIKTQLPVSFAQAPLALEAALQQYQPDAVLSLGVAMGRKKLTPELIAINLAHGRIADNDGQQPLAQPLISGGPDGLFSNLPVFRLAEYLEENGVPAAVSYSAGAYVCNCIMYHLMTWAIPRKIPAGFVHVPGVTEMPVEATTRAVELLVSYLVNGL